MLIIRNLLEVLEEEEVLGDFDPTNLLIGMLIIEGLLEEVKIEIERAVLEAPKLINLD